MRMGKKETIAAYLRRSGMFADNAEIHAILSDGRVRVGNRIAYSPSFQFRPHTDQVCIDEKPVESQKSGVYIAMNKPRGIICQKNDAKARPSVWDYLIQKGLSKKMVNSLVSVGRLDVGTEGLLILTTDGRLAYRILQPRHNIMKEYYAVISGEISDASMNLLRRGVNITVKEKGADLSFKTSPAKAYLISRSPNQSELRIGIIEGKKNQVRLMLSAVGHKVNYLQRIAIGSLLLSHIPPVGYRIFAKEEIERLSFGDQNKKD